MNEFDLGAFMRRIITFFLFQILLLCAALPAKVAEKEFKQISLKEGLSQSNVRSVFRDSKGFLWIGTLDGLNRYDGESMKIYSGSRHGELKNLTNIFFIVEDSSRKLWVGTGKGVFYFNRNEDNLVPLTPGDTTKLYRSYCMNDKEIVFVSKDALLRYDLATSKIKIVPYQSKDLHKLSSVLKATWIDKENIFLGDRWNGLFYCNINTGRVVKKNHSGLRYVTDVLQDSASNIWVSTYGNGILKFKKNGEMLGHLNKAGGTLPNDVVMSISLLSDGNLWIATDGDGICRYDISSNKTIPLNYSYGDITTSSVNSISCISEDQFNNVWIGTLRNGLLVLKDKQISSFTAAYLDAPYGMSASTATSFSYDKDAVWIGIDGGGLNRYDINKKEFRHYASTHKMKVASVVGLTDESLLFSVYREGLRCFDKTTGRVTQLSLGPDMESRIKKSWFSINLKRLNDRYVLMSFDSLYILDVKTNEYHVVRSAGNVQTEQGLKFSLSNDSATILFGDYYVYRFDPESQILSTVFTIKNERIGVIKSLAKQNNNQYWFCTESGLYTIDLNSGKIKQTGNSLIESPSVLAFSKDEKLWIGGVNSIYRYDPHTGQIFTYGESEGVMTNEYIGKSLMMHPDSSLFFGGTAGFCQINTHIPADTSSFVLPEVAEIIVDGKNMPGNESRSFVLNAGVESVSIRIIINGKDLFKKYHYRFKIISNEDSFYIESAKKPLLTLNKLQAGSYSVFVQYNLNNGEWTPMSHLIDLSVPPFWWKSKPFYAGVFFVLLIIVVLLVRWLKIRQKRVVAKQLAEYESEANEQKIRFLIHVNHELRTPLTLILAPLTRLHGQLDKLPADEMRRLLKNTSKHALRMKEVIDMILHLNKRESEVANEVTMNLSGWIDELIDLFRDEIAAKQLECIVTKEIVHDHLLVDEPKIRIVIVNLISNAIKYSRDYTTIRIDISQNENDIKVRVSDEGIGLHHVDRNNLFKPFYRGAENGKIEGFGIGLSYCKEILDYLGGTIEAFDNEKQGAVFVATFPFRLQENNVDSIDSRLFVSAQSDNYQLKHKEICSDFTVLIVEDEEQLLSFYQEEFSYVFSRVLLAKDGAEALDILSDNPVDLVISDVMMPRKNGYELCGEIKQNSDYSHIPVILLTALSGNEYSKEGYKCGADFYLSKPFETAEVILIVNNILNTRRALKQKYRELGYSVLPNEISASTEDEKFIKRLVRLVEENLDRSDLDVEQLSLMMGISRTGLYAKVKTLLGIGVKEFINSVRIKKATFLLEETELTIGEIAEKTGFSNQRYFSTVFKSEIEMTPTEYRNQKKQAV